MRTPLLRYKYKDRPEFDADFVRYPYGNPPNHIQGFWKIDHGYDFGSEQLDYEDHSMHMLHQRYSHNRSFGIVFAAVAGLSLMYYVWLEVPNTGVVFGHYNLDIEMNAIKSANDNEFYHDWEKIREEYREAQAKLEEEDEEDEDEDEDEDDESEESEDSEDSEESEESEDSEESEEADEED